MSTFGPSGQCCNTGHCPFGIKGMMIPGQGTRLTRRPVVLARQGREEAFTLVARHGWDADDADGQRIARSLD